MIQSAYIHGDVVFNGFNTISYLQVRQLDDKSEILSKTLQSVWEDLDLTFFEIA